MGSPHTGELLARIGGEEYRFDGRTWSGPVASVVKTLNAATIGEPTQHFTIDALAAKILRRAGIAGDIVSFRCDEWAGELPPGAVD